MKAKKDFTLKCKLCGCLRGHGFYCPNNPQNKELKKATNKPSRKP